MNDAVTPRPAPARPKLPALLYVLGAFGVLLGLGGSWVDFHTCKIVLETRDAYVGGVIESYHLQRDAGIFKVPAEQEETLTKVADAYYSRRYAALPLAAGGVLIGWMLAMGALRAMMGDKNGIALWSWAVLAALPFCMLSALLGLLTANDTLQALSGAPNAEVLQAAEMLNKGRIVVQMVLGSLYYVACALYLRKPALQARFSDGAERTKPSA